MFYFSGQNIMKLISRSWKGVSAKILVWCTLILLSQFTLQVDASQVGLHSVLLLEDSQGRTRPVTYASKALTASDTRYANVEREMLAVALGCIRFHHYLYGRKFVCQIDHKPLETIHVKHLSAASPRLHRLLLKLQPYDVAIKYVCQVRKFQLQMHWVQSAQVTRQKSRVWTSLSMM